MRGTASRVPPEPTSAAIAAGAEALGLQLQRAQLDRLVGFVSLLDRWNRAYNLTSIRDPREMVVHHILDCLAVVAPLFRHLELMGNVAGRPGVARTGGAAAGAPDDSSSGQAADARLLDVGSGGGLPGVVLAIAVPRLQVTCVDAVGKKAAFVQQVAGALGLANLRAVHGRVEQLPQGPGDLFDVITARAFASLPDFVRSTRHLLAAGGCWMAMKGHDPTQERGALPPDTIVFHVEPIHVPGLDASRCLVWMQPRVETEGG